MTWVGLSLASLRVDFSNGSLDMDILISRHECFKGMGDTEGEGDGMVEEETDRQTKTELQTFLFHCCF